MTNIPLPWNVCCLYILLRHDEHSIAMECLSCIDIFYCVIIYHVTAGLPKAVAWAEPCQSQAMIGSFGLAQDFSRPKPPQAKPKPGLLGQPRPGKSLGA